MQSYRGACARLNLYGDPSPPDWLEDGQEKDEVRSAVELLIGPLELEL